MTRAEEEQIGELLRQAAVDPAAPSGLPLAGASLKQGRRRLRRRRFVTAVAGVALVTASPLVIRSWPNDGQRLAVVPASGAPSGTVPPAIDCRDLGGNTTSGTVDSATSAGVPVAPAEQAQSWARESGANRRFAGIAVSGVAERGSGVVVALTDAHGVARALLTFERTTGGWQLVGVSTC